jgi:predicted transposase YbfD/YdcC
VHAAAAAAACCCVPTVFQDVEVQIMCFVVSIDVQVADFGLSRLMPEQGTHLSTLSCGTITHAVRPHHELEQQLHIEHAALFTFLQLR